MQSSSTWCVTFVDRPEVSYLSVKREREKCVERETLKQNLTLKNKKKLARTQ